MAQIPLPSDDVSGWLVRHLDGLFAGSPTPSARFRGGQAAADRALDVFDVTGYARRRNEVRPSSARGASGLSPYIRHGLLTLPQVWDAVANGPAADVAKFRDELMWQEFARHLYARSGARSRRELRYRSASAQGPDDPWVRSMRCVDDALSELERDGWLVNQARMWLASHWVVRSGADWRAGEDRFFRELLDGSRAANRLGWQWTAGFLTGRSYGFSRRQVERRAPELCRSCELSGACPIEEWPDDRPLTPIAEHGLSAGSDDEAGPLTTSATADPEAVWITAESLGDGDPALAANPGLPVLFVFDAPLLERLQLAAKRLLFMAETVADLSARREVRVFVGDPVRELRGVGLSVTHAPVPGWRRRAAALDVVETHPWPWLFRPAGRSVASFSAWRRSLDR